MALITPEAVAERLNVSAQTVRRWINDGRVPAYKLPSGQFRLDEAEVAAMLTPVSPSPSETDS